MSAFLGSLYTRDFSAQEAKAAGSNVALYEVVRDLPYQSDLLGRVVVIPAGLVTDFASIPRLLWNIIDPDDPRIAYPSVIHDYLYGQLGKLPDGFTYTREQADGVLREAMEACGAGNFVRNAVYQMVRRFGGSHWKSLNP